MKVVAFNGSPRPDGNCSLLLKEVFSRFEQHEIQTELVLLNRKRIKPCIACYKCLENKNQRCAIDDDLNGCIAEIMEAQAVILASPTYIGDVNSVTKALIDRAGFVARSNNNMFRRKVAAGLTTASWGGAIHTFETLNLFFLVGEMIVVGSSNWNLGFGREKGQVLQDQKALATVRTLGDNMSWLIKKLQ
ncbi:MAG: flavodoxin family protein [bacterium]|nr:flavodoxin family protein [bacterium]